MRAPPVCASSMDRRNCRHTCSVSPAYAAAVIPKIAVMIMMRANNVADKAVLQVLDPAFDGFAVVRDMYFDSARKLIEPYAKPSAK